MNNRHRHSVRQCNEFKSGIRIDTEKSRIVNHLIVRDHRRDRDRRHRSMPPEFTEMEGP